MSYSVSGQGGVQGGDGPFLHYSQAITVIQDIAGKLPDEDQVD